MDAIRRAPTRGRRVNDIIAAACLWPLLTVVSHAATTLTIEPNEPSLVSCLAFGAGPGAGDVGADNGAPGFPGTSPFMGFIYKDIPAFDLKPGDILAFDLGAVNDFDIEIDIAMAPTTANGAIEQSGSFTRVVSNTQTPLNPRGDTVFGNFEVQFTVENDFSFAGGGLIIRFSNGSEAYRADDQTCDQVGVVANATDTSGFFVRAFWKDADGVAPWDDGAEQIIGGFQIISTDVISLTGETMDASGAVIGEAAVGDAIAYRVNAGNQTQSDATGVVVTATLSDGLDFVQADATPAAAAVFAAGPPATVTWTVGALAAGAQASLNVDVEVQFDASEQTLTNSAAVTGVDAPFEISAPTQSQVTIDDVFVDALDTSGSGISLITIAYILLLMCFRGRRNR